MGVANYTTIKKIENKGVSEIFSLIRSSYSKYTFQWGGVHIEHPPMFNMNTPRVQYEHPPVFNMNTELSIIRTT